MAAAEPVIRAVLPDANVPVSVRTGGAPVRYGFREELAKIVDTWLDAHSEGIGCVVGDSSYTGTARVRSLPPESVKGMEFDLVVLVDPLDFGRPDADDVEGTVDRYVAMTRATQQLVVLTSRRLSASPAAWSSHESTSLSSRAEGAGKMPQAQRNSSSVIG